MSIMCSKKVATFFWSFMECLFFSSIVLGWTWMAVVFRNDGYFTEHCNITKYNQTRVISRIPEPEVIPKKKPLCRRTRDDRGGKVSEQASDWRKGSEDWKSSDQRELDFRSSPASSPSSSSSSPSSSSAVFRANALTSSGISQSVPNGILESGNVPRASGTSLMPPELQGHYIDFTEYAVVSGYCLTQNHHIRLMFSIIVIVRDLFTLPLGFFFDKYGTTRTRLLSMLLFALGTLMMTFTSDGFPWLVLLALSFTGLAGAAVLLTNLQTANLFGRKRHVVVSILVGAAYSNGIITLLMKLSHFDGVHIQSSFMFLTIAIVPMLVSTVAFLPKTRVPWPLPADYGKRRNQSLDEGMLRKQRAWQRRMSEAGLVRNRKPPPMFTPTATQSLFVWSVLWYSVQRLHEAVYETRVVDVADMQISDELDFETYFGVMQLMGVFLAPLAGLLIDRDPRPALGLTQATQQMQRLVPAIVVTSLLAALEIISSMFMGATAQGISVFFNILHKVFTFTTMCAFVMHLHFNHQHLGKFYGLTCTLSAVLATFQFPVRTYLIYEHGSMFPAQIFLLILNVISLAHGVNAWDHCRKRLIKDQSDTSSERHLRGASTGQAPLTIHIETDDSNLPNKGAEGGSSDPKAGPAEPMGVVNTMVSTLEETGLEMTSVPSPEDGHNGGAYQTASNRRFADEDDDDESSIDDENGIFDDESDPKRAATIGFV